MQLVWPGDSMTCRSPLPPPAPMTSQLQSTEDLHALLQPSTLLCESFELEIPWDSTWVSVLAMAGIAEENIDLVLSLLYLL